MTWRGLERVVDLAACRDLPADWWDTGDDGNRLALAICNLRCPVRVECGQGREYGRIAGGVAHDDTGRPRPVCECGYPITGKRCTRCHPRVVALPQPRKRRELAPCGTPAAVARHRYHREPIDEACREAQRTYDRERKRARRGVAA